MMRKELIASVVLTLLTVPATAQEVEYRIERVHSAIQFSIPYMKISQVHGRFTEYTGTVDFNEEDITQSTIEIKIMAHSIDTGIDLRDNHLRSPDYFDIEKYPEITFRSRRIEKTPNHYVLFGSLTMHGVSCDIEIPFTGPERITSSLNPSNPKARKREYLAMHGTVTLNRHDFGMSFPGKVGFALFVGDEVEIELVLVLQKRETNATQGER